MSRLGTLKLPKSLPPAKVKQLASTIDEALNGDASSKTGFVLMVFPVRPDDGVLEGGFCNYISNVDQKSVVALLHDQLSAFGHPVN